MASIKNCPTPTAGVSLGVAGILLYWVSLSHQHPLSILLMVLGFLISGTLVSMVLAKFVRHPKLLWLDLQHPTVGSVVPTVAMTLFLLSHIIAAADQTVGIIIWC